MSRLRLMSNTWSPISFDDVSLLPDNTQVRFHAERDEDRWAKLSGKWIIQRIDDDTYIYVLEANDPIMMCYRLKVNKEDIGTDLIK